MPTITLTTDLPAPIRRCFDLARSIDLHVHSMAHTGERAIAGRVSGLVELGDTVTWQARHLWVTQRLTSRITALEAPVYFADEMVPRRGAGGAEGCGHGAFRSFRHEHRFEELRAEADPRGPLTRMTDVFEFESPLGILGRAVNAAGLTRYMRRLLEHRNRVLRDTIASGDWRRFL